MSQVSLTSSVKMNLIVWYIISLLCRHFDLIFSVTDMGRWYFNPLMLKRFSEIALLVYGTYDNYLVVRNNDAKLLTECC